MHVMSKRWASPTSSRPFWKSILIWTVMCYIQCTTGHMTHHPTLSKQTPKNFQSFLDYKALNRSEVVNRSSFLIEFRAKNKFRFLHIKFLIIEQVQLRDWLSSLSFIVSIYTRITISKKTFLHEGHPSI